MRGFLQSIGVGDSGNKKKNKEKNKSEELTENNVAARKRQK